MTNSPEEAAPALSSELSSSIISRVPRHRVDDAWIAHRRMAASTRFFPIWDSRVLVTNDSPPHAAGLGAQSARAYLSQAESVVLLGEAGERSYFAIGLPCEDLPPPDGLDRFGTFRRLREVAPLLDRDSAALLAYAKAMVDYHHLHQFCGRCGAPAASAHAGHLRICTNEHCRQQDFPRIDPAIIVLVRSQERCLLGRQTAWKEHVYSIIAGFVEAGETLEAAVAREVREETGISVADILYQSSQPWPFPRSLMIGFTAEAKNATIRLRDGELEDARWFSREDIVRGIKDGTLILPSSISISRRLIEAWFNADSAISMKDIAPD